MFAAQARYNRINQFTPQGSLIFDEDPGGHATATMTHSPEQQSLIDAQNQMRMDAFGRLGSLLGFSPGRGAPPRVGTPDKPGKINDLVNQDGGAGGGSGGAGGGSGGAGGGSGGAGGGSGGAGGGNFAPGGGGVDPATGAPLTPGAYSGSFFGGLPEWNLPSDSPGAPGQIPGLRYSLQRDPLGEHLGPELPGSVDELNQFGDEAREAFFERGMGLLRPEQERAREEAMEYASNRGLPIGSEIENVLSDRLARQQGEQQMNLGLESIIRGDQAMQNRLGMIQGIRGGSLQERLSQAGLANQARQQAFQEFMASRQAQLGERGLEFDQLASILGLTPTGGAGANMGGFFQPGQVDTNQAYNMHMQQSQWRDQQQGQLLNSLLGFAGQAGGMAMMSGRKLKKAITPMSSNGVLDKIKSVPIYQWLYRNEDDNHVPHIGPVAEDFNEAFDNPGLIPSQHDEGIDIPSLHGVALAGVQALIKKVDELEAELKALRGVV